VRVLVLNPGSSSLKAALLDPPGRDPLASVVVDLGADATVAEDLRGAVDEAIRAVRGEMAGAVGYRVVHGGTRFTEPTLLDDAAVTAIADLADLAPLHSRVTAETIRAGRAALPDRPHVAAFDTAFHATLTEEAIRYPVPERWFAEWGIRRFGFHGLSVEWSIRRASQLLERPADELRLVVAHLGSGCSVTAIDGGRPVDTSMGMTPLEGLMMGTRAGSIDPGILLRLLRERRLTLDELEEELDHGSGLKGVSGRTSDVRQLQAAESAGDPGATLALALFVRRAAQGIAAAATTLRTLDAIVFTGGIGEHAAELRARIVDQLAVLGAPAVMADGSTGPDSILAAGPPAILRIAAREDIVIADATAALARSG
jgi:acetate kinase